MYRQARQRPSSAWRSADGSMPAAVNGGDPGDLLENLPMQLHSLLRL